MLDHGNRTLVATVIFVDIVGYSKHTVSEQMQLRTRFNEIVHGVLDDTGPNERILLDTGDGAALCFFGDPENVLGVANRLRNAILKEENKPALKMRLGINLGGVKLISDINGHPSVIGDAINSAQRIMSFAEPNQILVSRSFCDLISSLNPGYNCMFQYMGVRKDKHIREHEIYVVDRDYSGTSAHAVEGTEEGSARFEADLLSRIEACSIKYIGPIARVMVNKTLGHVRDPEHLCHRLADYVPEEVQRADFLREALSCCGAALEKGESD